MLKLKYMNEVVHSSHSFYFFCLKEWLLTPTSTQHVCACMHTYVCFLFLAFSLLLPSSKALCDHKSYQCFPVEFPPFPFMSELDKRPACSFHSSDSSLLVLEIAGPLATSPTPFTSGPGCVHCRCIALALYIVLMKASVPCQSFHRRKTL